MLKKIGEIDKITTNSTDDTFCVYPILDADVNLFDLFNMSKQNMYDMVVYVYVWHPDEEKFLRGRISTCYYTWFIMRSMPMNQLEYFDYLYTKEHIEEIKYKGGMGIIYKVIKNEE